MKYLKSWKKKVANYKFYFLPSYPSKVNGKTRLPQINKNWGNLSTLDQPCKISKMKFFRAEEMAQGPEFRFPAPSLTSGHGCTHL